MINSALSVSIECLVASDVQHSAFVHTTGKVELHLWQHERLTEVLQILESRGVKCDSVISMPDETEPNNLFYIIKF